MYAGNPLETPLQLVKISGSVKVFTMGPEIPTLDRVLTGRLFNAYLILQEEFARKIGQIQRSSSSDSLLVWPLRGVSPNSQIGD